MLFTEHTLSPIHGGCCGTGVGKVLSRYGCHTYSKSQVFTQNKGVRKTSHYGWTFNLGALQSLTFCASFPSNLSWLTALLAAVVVQSSMDWQSSQHFDKRLCISSLLRNHCSLIRLLAKIKGYLKGSLVITAESNKFNLSILLSTKRLWHINHCKGKFKSALSKNILSMSLMKPNT